MRLSLADIEKIKNMTPMELSVNPKLVLDLISDAAAAHEISAERDYWRHQCRNISARNEPRIGEIGL